MAGASGSVGSDVGSAHIPDPLKFPTRARATPVMETGPVVLVGVPPPCAVSPAGAPVRKACFLAAPPKAVRSRRNVRFGPSDLTAIGGVRKSLVFGTHTF